MKTKIAIFLFVVCSFCMLAQGEMSRVHRVSSMWRDSSSTVQDTIEKQVDEKNKKASVNGRDTIDQFTADTTAVIADSIKAGVLVADSLATDSVAADSVKSKSALDQPVEYTAKDSVTFEAGMGNANLYGESKVNYQNLELTADLITMNMDSSIVHAVGRMDSTGQMKGQPVFKQGSDEYEPEKISYNFKTRKAFIDNVYTPQGNGFMISQESKRDGEGVMYVRHGKYTTCNARHPHFYLALTRAKVRPGKDVVFGPAYRGCAIAFSHSIRFLPLQQEIFIRFYNADIWR